MSKIKNKHNEEKQKEIFIEELISSVKSDFFKRQKERRALELQWRLNLDFVAGNQYVLSNQKGEIVEGDKNYYWERRDVYNHIAPIVETRLAKLSRVRPKMGVRASSGDDKDLYIARMSTKILNGICSEINFSETIASATLWSEICGTAFYKIAWNRGRGLEMGEIDNKKIHTGDIEITVCPPFEIYPDNLNAKNMDEVKSIIHAKSMSIDDVYNTWNVLVESEQVESFTLSPNTYSYNKVTNLENYALVIEKYEMPTRDYPFGRLIIVCGNNLLYCGELPYLNIKDGRGLPFVRQLSIRCAGSFFGTSLVERCIPIQRAYNNIKNRKHEFLNRIAMGVLAVEDGSVDTDSLQEEGLPPGKVVIYRQGARPPQMMDCGRVPNEFTYEEDRLLNEFINISGVSEVMRNSGAPNSITSGVAISLLIEQDDTRLSLTADNIRNAVKGAASQILRIYKQFADTPRLVKVAGEDGSIDVVFFEKSDIYADDIVFETENELSETPAQRKNMLIELLRTGILSDESGRLSGYTKAKVLDQLGYGNMESTNQLTSLQIKRAAIENYELIKNDEKPTDIDDHALHIAEHTKFILSSDFNEKMYKENKAKYYEHIGMHKLMQSLEGKAGQQSEG